MLRDQDLHLPAALASRFLSLQYFGQPLPVPPRDMQLLRHESILQYRLSAAMALVDTSRLTVANASKNFDMGSPKGWWGVGRKVRNRVAWLFGNMMNQ